MNAVVAPNRQSFSGIDNLLGIDADEYVDLPGATTNQQSGMSSQRLRQQPPIEQVRGYGELPVAPEMPVAVELASELPVAPEDLGADEEPFDLYAWMEENVQAIKSDRQAAESAGRTVQEGVDKMVGIARGMQQATAAMAKSFQGADDERIAKIISMILEQQTAQTGTPNTKTSTVTLDDIDNKIVSPLKLLLYAAAGSILGFCIVTIMQKII